MRGGGGLHILGGDGGDALGGHLVGVDVEAEGQRREDADLPAGVQAFYIGGGIAFGVAHGLGFLEGGFKGGVLLEHLG